MTTQTLAEMLAALTPEKRSEINNALIDAGITREFNGNHKRIFVRLRNQSRGKAKKIYAALSRSTPEQMERMTQILLTHKPSSHANANSHI